MAAALICALAGCSNIGPDALRETRPLYNEAVQQTNDEELLTNLVRIHYRDTLYFTTVERIAVAREFNQSLGAAGSITSTRNSAATSTTSALSRVLSLGPGSVAVNEKPTIFYAPLEGEKFVRQMMTPMNPQILLLQVKSGWSLDRVFSVGIQEMNGLLNAPTAAGPQPSRAPEYVDFREAVKLLRGMQRENKLLIGRNTGEDKIVLQFVRNSGQEPDALRFKALLNLDPAQDKFYIVSAVEQPNKNTIAVITRPLISAMHYLAEGVESPERDIKAGKVRLTTTDGDQPFDWQDLLGGVFRVRTSDSQPSDASVAVNYRGTWFYIADDDLDSKSTFVLLNQLIQLHSTAAPPGPGLSFSFGTG